MICADCGHVAYENPKVVVGSVVIANGAVLMLGETLEEGAAPEAWEEAQVEIVIDGILGVFSISRIGQVQVIFRGRFASADSPQSAAGPESQEVALFSRQCIPHHEIAFPSVSRALEAWLQAGTGPLGVPAHEGSTP
jgi:ADP-ribose pyrophosphatase YjhB (NUDIX family)